MEDPTHRQWLAEAVRRIEAAASAGAGKLRDSGKAILLVSAELEEVISLSDRILVLYEGEVVAQFMRGEATRHEIGMYMLGSKRMELSEDAL